LELAGEVLREPMEERPQEGAAVDAPEPEEEPDFDMEDLN
jgi:hypothetical protein